MSQHELIAIQNRENLRTIRNDIQEIDEILCKKQDEAFVYERHIAKIRRDLMDILTTISAIEKQ